MIWAYNAINWLGFEHYNYNTVISYIWTRITSLSVWRVTGTRVDIKKVLCLNIQQTERLCTSWLINCMMHFFVLKDLFCKVFIKCHRLWVFNSSFNFLIRFFKIPGKLVYVYKLCTCYLELLQEFLNSPDLKLNHFEAPFSNSNMFSNQLLQSCSWFET